MRTDRWITVHSLFLLYGMAMTPLWRWVTGGDGPVLLRMAALLLAVLVTATLFLLVRKRKALEYDILAVTGLLDGIGKAHRRVRVQVNDQPVQDVRVVRIRLRNAGTEPIRAADFLRPVSFSVPSGARILDAEVVAKKPFSVEALLDQEEQKVALRPTLLHARDVVVLQLLIANGDGTLLPDAHLAGAELKAPGWPWATGGAWLCVTLIYLTLVIALLSTLPLMALSISSQVSS